MDLSLRKLRKNIAAFSVLALFASFLVIGTANAAVAVDIYDDVNGDEWYAADVQWGLDSGILDDTQAYFRGGDNASRAEFFKMTAAGAGIPEAACDETLFPDLNADLWSCGWITAMAEAGIVSGDGASSQTPGHVRPNDNVLRSEAGKVVVEAYGLIGPSLGSDVFSDVPAGIWYDEYMGVAKDNCVFQGVGGGTTVEPGRNIVRAEAIAVVSRGANPTTECETVVVSAGALTVSVDGSTPPSSLIPRNANSVLYVVWGLEASNDEDILIEELTVSRTGLGDPEDFDEIRLYVDGVQQGSRKNINTQSNDATFALAGDPIVVPAGGELLLQGVGDMSANENAENALCIASPDDVFAVGADSGAQVDVGGSFAACGDYMYTGSATVGDLEYTVSDFGGDINVGDTDVDVARVRVEVDGEDGTIQRIAIKQTGSADPEDFANTMWYQSNVAVEGTDCLWSGDYFSCDFTGADLTITDGGVTNLDLRTDVVGGVGSTVAFDIHRDTDVFAIGGQHGYGLNVTDGDDTFVPVAREIVGGRIAFSASSNNPTLGDISPNAEDHDFLGFNVATAGDSVDWTRFTMNTHYTGAMALGEVDDLKIWQWDAGLESWKVVAGSQDPGTNVADCVPTPPAFPYTGVCSLLFEDTIFLPSSTTTTFMATMDADGDATDGASFWLELTDTSFEAEYTADNENVVVSTDVSGLPILGKAQTVAPPNLTVEVSSSPWDQVVVKNQPEVDLVGYDLTASTASDIIVRTIELTCTEDPGSATADGDCDDFFTNVEMFHKDGGSLFFLDDTAFTGEAGVFNNVNLDVLGGQTEKVLTRADVTSSPDSTDGVYLELAGDGMVAADDEFGFALSATQLDVCVTGTEGCTDAVILDNEAPLITFRDNGQLEVSIEDTLSDAIILDGTNDVLVAEITIREGTDSEDVLLRELRLTNDIDGVLGCDASGVSTVKIPYPDVDNPYTAALQSLNNIAEFSFETTGDRRVAVPKDGTIVLPVYIDTNTIGSGGAASGDCVNIQLFDLDGDDYDLDPTLNTNGVGGDVDMEAVGAASGELLDATLGGDITGTGGFDGLDYYDVASPTAETYTIRNNKPTISTLFELSNGSDVYGFGYNPTNSQAVLAFEVSAEGTDTMTMYDMQLGLSNGGLCGALGTADHLMYLENDWLSNNDPLATDSVDAGGQDGLFEDTAFVNGVGITLLGGNSASYVVATDTAGYGCAFDSAPLDTVEFWIDDFLWSDGDAPVPPGIDTTGITNDTINSNTAIIFG